MYLPGLPSLTRDLGSSASAAQLTITGVAPVFAPLIGGQALARLPPNL